LAKRRLVGSYLGPYLLDFFHHLRFHGFFFRFSQGRQTSSFDCDPGIDDLGLDDVELLLGVLLKQLWVGRLQLGDLVLHELTSGVIADTLFLVRGGDHDLFVDELADQACSLIRRDAFRKVGFHSCFSGCVIYILVLHGLRPVTHLRHFSFHDHLLPLRFLFCFLRFSQGRQASSFDCNPGIDDLGLDDVELLLGVLLKQLWVGRLQLCDLVLHELTSGVKAGTLLLLRGGDHDLFVDELADQACSLIRRDAFREEGCHTCFSGCVIYILVSHGLCPLAHLRVLHIRDFLFRLRFHGCFLSFSQGRQAVSFDCNPGIDDLGLDDVDLLLGVLLKQHRVGRLQLGNFCLHEIQNSVAWLYTLVLACGRIHNLRVNKLVNKSSCLIRRDAFREVGGEPGFSGCVIHVLVLQGLHPLCDLRL